MPTVFAPAVPYMLHHPDIDPIALSLGPLKVHWYGLMYLLGFYGWWWLSVRRGRMAHLRGWSEQRISDLLFYAVMGVILGGRIGYTFFYNLDGFLADPLVIFRIWQGGMSFHGGLLGVTLAFWVFAKTQKLRFFEVADFAAVGVPFALFTGRVGNFINAELWGSTTTLPWGMVFPNAGALPRHPSMLYEALLEGLVLLAILWWYGKKPRPEPSVAALFLLGYGVFRFAVEFVRVPDAQLGYLYGTGWFTMGMQLCVPMIVLGGGLFAWAHSRETGNGRRER